jgi:predicted acyl esterase
MKNVILSSLLLSSLHLFAQSAVSYYPITIPARDGKSLAADLYASDTTVSKPVILVQTPYNKNLYRIAINIPPEAGGSAFPYDSLHYNYVVLDWRGFYGSKSAAVAGYDRGLDGYDAVEWIAAQRWCNGRVGTWGPSALGAIQFMTAKHHPPHLVCSVPLVKDFKTKYTDFYYGGDYRREHVTTLQALGLTDTTLILAHPTSDLTWQAAERLSDYPDSIAVPMLLISGWYDHFPDDVIRAFDDLRRESDPSVRTRHRLMMGPWMHEGVGKLKQGVLEYPNAVGSGDSVALRFFDYYLREIANGYDTQPNVRYYQMGTNEWHATDDWYSLCRAADTLSLYLSEEQSLSEIAPASGTGADTILFDPRNPSPTIGGARLVPPGESVPAGPQDQHDSVESRGDVLVYSTPPLTGDLTVDGGMRVELFVSSDRFDTDFSVRLCDLYPDGRSILMTQGIRRMRFRNGFRPQDTSGIVPFQVYPVTVDLQNIALTFLKGHRIRIDVSSSDHPQYDVNPNTGDRLYTPGSLLVATNQVHRSAIYPSRLLLPLLAIGSSQVEGEGDRAGAGLAIGEGYPEPFSSSATFPFFLPKQAHCSLELFDLLGNRRRVLIEEEFDAGGHEVRIDGIDLPAGAYIIRLQAGGMGVQKIVQVVR